MDKDKLGPFAIFANTNYSLYFSGQLVSLVGTWMQQVALAWYTYELTKSPFLLAVVGVSAQLPSLVVMPLAGVFADRVNRHKIIITTQILAMVQASLLTYLTLTHQVQVSHLVLLGLMAGLINSFDMPARSAFAINLVSKEELTSAVAMNSSLMNITRLIGPALAGFIVGAWGAGICFALNAASYFAVIIALLMIRGDFTPKPKEKRGVFDELKDGVKYTWKTSPIRAVLLLIATIGIGASGYMLLLPMFVKQIGGDANTLGYLMSASAAGSLVGTLTLASRKSVIGLGRWVVVSSILFSCALIGFSFIKSFWPAIFLITFIGATMMLMMAACSTILQSVVEEDKRGRVMALFAMSFMGAAPFGGMISGAVADHFGFQVTVLGCGIYCLIVALTFAYLTPRLRQEAKPVYVQFGLLKPDSEAPTPAEAVVAARTAQVFDITSESERRDARTI
ncbi:MAG: MFS transporter [Candidatus Melainabacteria bacterium]|nr:MFS transporter [Candidatus Melainabacteria bacterium]